MIEVRLLGPPEVRRDGTPVALDTRKALALLALLALTDRPRPRDTLAAMLWSESDTDRARGALRRTLSTLRTAIGAEHLEAGHDQVRLVRGPGLAVDVDRFRSLRADDDPEGAAAQFHGALLEGFVVRDAPEFEEWVEAEGELLRRELTATLAAVAAAREAGGDLAGAVAACRRWLSLDPLHEPAHQSLIRLHATAGDRAAALVQYRECVRTLSRELGVPPLTETTELYDAVNRGTFTPAPTPAAPPAASSTTAVPGPAPTPLVGRADEVRALVAAYEAVGADGRVAVVEGEAGIGKTRLVDELAAVVTGRGGAVLRGGGYDGEAGLAYRPVVELLRDRLADDPAWASLLDRRVLAEGARLLPALATGRELPEAPALDQPGAETRFLSALWELLTAAAESGSGPGLLVLDDAQWADEATLRLLGYGLRRLAGRPLLVVLVWRTPHDHPLRSATAQLVRTGGGSRVALGRLDEESVRTLVESAGDGSGPEVARRLWEVTEGVPLLVVQYLRAAEGTEGADADAVPVDVREALASRLEPVSETARQVLAAASVVGGGFDVDTVRAVSGRTDEETVTALEEVVARGLVRERDTDYDFDHGLLRSLVYDGTSLARRRLLHARAAEQPGLAPAVTARHLRLAGRDAAAAAAYLEAGRQARALFAHDEALAHLRAALDLGHPDRCAVETEVADVQVLRGDYAGAARSLESAAAHGSPEQLAGVEHRLGRLQHRRGEYAAARAHLRDALDLLRDDDAGGRAAVTADLALAAQALGEPDDARTLAQASADLASRAGDTRALCQAANLLGMVAVEAGDLDEGLDQLGTARRLADELGDEDLRVAVDNNRGLALRARGDLAAALTLTEAALASCVALGDRHREAALHNNLADLLHASGRGDEAMRHLKAAVEIFAEVGRQEELRPGIWKLTRW